MTTGSMDEIIRPLIDKLSDAMDPDTARLFVLDVANEIWNARGAADLGVINAELSARMGDIGYSVSTVDTAIHDALRTLDR